MIGIERDILAGLTDQERGIVDEIVDGSRDLAIRHIARSKASVDGHTDLSRQLARNYMQGQLAVDFELKPRQVSRERRGVERAFKVIAEIDAIDRSFYG